MRGLKFYDPITGLTFSVAVKSVALSLSGHLKGRSNMDKQTVLDRLDLKGYYLTHYPELKINSEWGQTRCNFNSHQDNKPSLFVNLTNGSFHCKGCGVKGSIFDHYMKIHNVDYRTAFNHLSKEAGLATEPQKKIIKTYDYTDESGNLLFQTVRYEPKDFKQRRPDGKDGWIYNLQGIRLVPYNLPDVMKAKSIVIVEGEKDADSLKAIGFTATCNPMGAGKWKTDYSESFKGKRVVIIPDNDAPGKRHAQTVAKNLKDLTESVKIVELPGLPEKGDVSDWIAQGHTKEELIEIIKQTPEWEVPKEDYPLSFLKKGSDLIALECNVEWVIDRLVPKQSITLLHGKGGIGKTWISLILGNAISKGISFMDLTTQQMPIVFVDFENSLPVLVERVKKIEASEVLFWHNTNEVRPPKLDREDWEQYKSLPIGLLIFDTLRASQGKDENSSQDMASIMSRLKELRDMGFTILLLHHTPKSNDRTYKGSTAIMDLADHVLSLHKVKRGSLEDVDDDDEEGYYRLGTKEKTRYEPFHIFLDFDPEKGFVVAPDPDEEDMKGIYTLIVELRDSTGELPIQSQIFDKAKAELNIGNSKTRKLLKKGAGKCWNSTQIPERRNAKVFEPISVCQFVTPIYTQQTNKLPENPSQTLDGIEFSVCQGGIEKLQQTNKLPQSEIVVNQFVNGHSKVNIPQSLDTVEFVSLSGGIKQTNKLEVIDLEHAQMEIIE